MMKDLKELDCSVLTATNGKEAVDRFLKVEGQVDLVILDMIMPEMDGRECFFELKRISPEVKIILASGFSREDDVKELLDEGLCGFIRKPYTIGSLSRILSEVLNKEDCDEG